LCVCSKEGLGNNTKATSLIDVIHGEGQKDEIIFAHKKFKKHCRILNNMNFPAQNAKLSFSFQHPFIVTQQTHILCYECRASRAMPFERKLLENMMSCTTCMLYEKHRRITAKQE
jgi:hypothetical protein